MREQRLPLISVSLRSAFLFDQRFSSISVSLRSTFPFDKRFPSIRVSIWYAFPFDQRFSSINVSLRSAFLFDQRVPCVKSDVTISVQVHFGKILKCSCNLRKTLITTTLNSFISLNIYDITIKLRQSIHRITIFRMIKTWFLVACDL